MCRLGVRYDGILELADLGLERVASVEEHNFVAALGNKGVDLGRLEVLAASNDAVDAHLEFIWGSECHELVANAHSKSRKILAGAV